MKKTMSKMCLLILTLLSVIIVTGCGEIFIREVNEKPDDDISEAIHEAIGRKKMYYHGKQYSNRGEVAWYEYTVHDYEDENVLTDMVEAVNVVLEEREISEKVHLGIREEMGFDGGGTEGVASLSNYNENEDGSEKYDFLQNLYIRGTEDSEKGDNSLYNKPNKPSTYINLPNIKSLVVSEKIAQIAEDEGIDWYEIWPDLEHYEVLEE